MTFPGTNGLRPKKGYRFVKDSDSTLAIELIEGGKKVGSLGCGCWFGVGCFPIESPDGIAICFSVPGCIKCGLALTSGGVRTELFQYTKRR